MSVQTSFLGICLVFCRHFWAVLIARSHVREMRAKRLVLISRRDELMRRCRVWLKDWGWRDENRLKGCWTFGRVSRRWLKTTNSHPLQHSSIPPSSLQHLVTVPYPSTHWPTVSRTNNQPTNQTGGHPPENYTSCYVPAYLRLPRCQPHAEEDGGSGGVQASLGDTTERRAFPHQDLHPHPHHRDPLHHRGGVWRGDCGREKV